MTEVNDFFSAYGVSADEVSEDPFTVPDNTYEVMVTQAEVTNFGKNGGPEFFSIQISVNDNAEHHGKNANLLFRMTPLTAQDQDDFKTANARTLSNYKKAMLDFGLSEEGVARFNPRTMGGKLVGIKGTARLMPSKKSGYNNVSNFQRHTVAAPAESAPVNTGATEPNPEALNSLLSGF